MRRLSPLVLCAFFATSVGWSPDYRVCETLINKGLRE